MDSIPLEMDDIFDDYEEIEDFNPSRLPDLEDELEPMRDPRDGDDEADNDEAGTDNAELLAKLKSMKGASKHAARKSIPKLDSARLTGERGIPILPKVFKNVHLKGKNHEAEDLKVIMQHLEHWAHRLFPKMPFNEVLERTERLGAKNEVKTCLKKIRLDMPVLASDYVEGEEDNVQRTSSDSEEDNVHRAGQNSRSQEVDEDETQELMREYESSTSNSGKDKMELEQTPMTRVQLSQESSLTDEIKSRIEHNKRLAMERRAKKAGITQKDDNHTSITFSHTLTSDQQVDKQNEDHVSHLSSVHALEGDSINIQAIHKKNTTSGCISPSVKITGSFVHEQNME